MVFFGETNFDICLNYITNNIIDVIEELQLIILTLDLDPYLEEEIEKILVEVTNIKYNIVNVRETGEVLKIVGIMMNLPITIGDLLHNFNKDYRKFVVKNLQDFNSNMLSFLIVKSN